MVIINNDDNNNNNNNNLMTDFKSICTLDIWHILTSGHEPLLHEQTCF